MPTFAFPRRRCAIHVLSHRLDVQLPAPKRDKHIVHCRALAYRWYCWQYTTWLCEFHRGISLVLRYQRPSWVAGHKLPIEGSETVIVTEDTIGYNHVANPKMLSAILIRLQGANDQPTSSRPEPSPPRG